MHAYSKLGQAAPRGTKGWPVVVSTRWLPTTWSCGAATAAGVDAPRQAAARRAQMAMWRAGMVVSLCGCRPPQATLRPRRARARALWRHGRSRPMWGGSRSANSCSSDSVLGEHGRQGLRATDGVAVDRHRPEPGRRLAGHPAHVDRRVEQRLVLRREDVVTGDERVAALLEHRCVAGQPVDLVAV